MIIAGAPKSPKVKTPKRKKSIEGGDTAKIEEVSGDQGGITIVEYDAGAGGDKESEEKGIVYFIYIIHLHPLG